MDSRNSEVKRLFTSFLKLKRKMIPWVSFGAASSKTPLLHSSWFLATPFFGHLYHLPPYSFTYLMKFPFYLERRSIKDALLSRSFSSHLCSDRMTHVSQWPSFLVFSKKVFLRFWWSCLLVSLLWQMRESPARFKATFASLPPYLSLQAAWPSPWSRMSDECRTSSRPRWSTTSSLKH